MLHDVKVDLQNLFPVCQSVCPHSKNCANHISANEFRGTVGMTPDLKQVVKDSWRCHQDPKEELKGAILIDGRFYRDIISGPNWFDGFLFGDFSNEEGEEDED